MENINKVELCGFVGTVLIEKTESSNWVKFSLATSLPYSKDGVQYYETTWHYVVAFQNGIKEDLAKILKGCGVHLTGRIRTSRYTAQDGTEKSVNEILASSLEIVQDSKATTPAEPESK